MFVVVQIRLFGSAPFEQTLGGRHRQIMPPPDRMTEVTDSYMSWKGWSAADFARVDIEDSLYFQAELRASGIRSVAGLRVGELGYGNGTFAGWVRAAGGHWVGRETIPELRARAMANGFETIAPELGYSRAWGEGSLDLIVAFDVVEHLSIDAIQSFLRESHAALRPDGLLLLRLPSGDSPFSSAIFHGDLTHRTLLGSSAVRQLACSSGFVVKQIRSPVLSTAGYPLVRRVRRVAVRMAQMVTFGFIRNFLMANEGAILSPNMIVVLAPVVTNQPSHITM